MKYSQNMHPNMRELIAKIEEIAPVSNASSWDNSGLQFIAECEEIHKVAICLDPSPLNIQKAIEMKAQMLITHHPLALEPKYLNLFDDHYQAIKLLMQANMPLYSAHTSLDVTPFATWLADELFLQDCQVLEPSGVDKNSQPFGFGAIGNLPAAMSVPELKELLSSFFPQTLLRFAGDMPKQIERVAFCGGSGASLIEHAKAKLADIYISGDFKYHSTENLSSSHSTGTDKKSLLLLDIGHFSLEEEMMRRFSQYFQEQMPKLDICFIPSKDPFYTL